MMTLREQTCKTTDSYCYLSGRVKVMELSLIDSSRLTRLIEAKTEDDISRILAECGYPSDQSPEDMLSAESIAIIEWLQEEMPEPIYAETFLAFHDGHNLKLALKKLLTHWMQRNPRHIETQSEKIIEKRDDQETEKAFEKRPVFGLGEGVPPLGDAVSMALLPASVPPSDLYQYIAEDRIDDLPGWLGKAAHEAIKQYMNRYELGDVDSYLDQQAWRQAHFLANQTGNAFFIFWLRHKTDLINFQLLLRTRAMRSGEETLKRTLLPGGLIDEAEILNLYNEPDEAIQSFYKKTPYSELAEWSKEYEKGQAARFSRIADHFLMAYVQKARRIVVGPEVPLGFVLTRQAEIMNVRIILSCLRNNLPKAQLQNLLRDISVGWR